MSDDCECFDASALRVGRATDAELDALPIVQRNVFVPFVHNGASYEAISEHLGIPIGTVRSRLHRARKRIALLRAAIAKAEGPKPFYGAQCLSYPNCSGGCGCGCTHEIEAAKAEGDSA